MPSFTQVEKFLGFAAKETAETVGGLRWTGERAFKHFLSGTTLSTTVLAEEKTGAFIATSLEGKTARVSSATAFIGKQGHGEAGYEAIADYLFSKTEARELTSDIVGGTKLPAERMWQRMVRRGIAEPFAYGPAGKQKIGWRITPETLRTGRAAQQLKDQVINETVMHLGQGHDNSSMLRRSLNSSAQGSRRMTGAL